MLEFEYRTNASIDGRELLSLFQAAGWQSAQYPERLTQAIHGSDTVVSAWQGGRLVGLASALDDGTLTAYLHYLLVRPEFRGQGIGTELLRQMKSRYAGYLYLILIAEEAGLVGYYHRLGFQTVDGAVPMAIVTL